MTILGDSDATTGFGIRPAGGVGRLRMTMAGGDVDVFVYIKFDD